MMVGTVSGGTETTGHPAESRLELSIIYQIKPLSVKIMPLFLLTPSRPPDYHAHRHKVIQNRCTEPRATAAAASAPGMTEAGHRAASRPGVQARAPSLGPLLYGLLTAHGSPRRLSKLNHLHHEK